MEVKQCAKMKYRVFKQIRFEKWFTRCHHASDLQQGVQELRGPDCISFVTFSFVLGHTASRALPEDLRLPSGSRGNRLKKGCYDFVFLPLLIEARSNTSCQPIVQCFLIAKQLRFVSAEGVRLFSGLTLKTMNYRNLSEIQWKYCWCWVHKTFFVLFGLSLIRLLIELLTKFSERGCVPGAAGR